MTLPCVSILIPVYNRSKYIEECIRSALDQTFTDIEVVVVDNASDDGTWEICQQFAVLDSRVRIFRNKKNVGPVRNWMRCVEESHGRYSKLLFSDDLMEPSCIEKMLEPLQFPDVGFVFCAANIGQTKEHSNVNYASPSNADMLFESTNYISLLICGSAPFSPSAVLIRKSDLLHNLHLDFPTSINHTYANNGAGPDVMIMLLTANCYPKVAWISTPLVFFRAHPGSLTVENKNYAITEGYTSIISWYLINNNRRIEWINYVTKTWLSILLNRKKFLNPYQYLKNYESDGRLSDVFCMLVFIPVIALGKMMKKINNR